MHHPRSHSIRALVIAFLISYKDNYVQVSQFSTAVKILTSKFQRDVQNSNHLICLFRLSVAPLSLLRRRQEQLGRRRRRQTVGTVGKTGVGRRREEARRSRRRSERNRRPRVGRRKIRAQVLLLLDLMAVDRAEAGDDGGGNGGAFALAVSGGEHLSARPAQSVHSGVVLPDLDGEGPDEVGEAVGDVAENKLLVGVLAHTDSQAAGLK
jgi:hypothetical protein